VRSASQTLSIPLTCTHAPHEDPSYPSFPTSDGTQTGQGTYPPRNWSRSPAGIVHAGEPLEHANVLRRLAQALDRVSAELRELVKGTAPVVRERSAMSLDGREVWTSGFPAVWRLLRQG
jgi:hypothetical protein